jgi:hypothetical protein
MFATGECFATLAQAMEVVSVLSAQVLEVVSVLLVKALNQNRCWTDPTAPFEDRLEGC